MALPAGYHCTNRPFRNNPRKYTPKDLARIAKYVKEEGHPILLLMSVVALSLGFGAVICRLSKSLRRWELVFRFVKQIAAIQASALAIRVFIQWLTGAPIKAIPVVNRVAAVAIAILLAVEAILLAIGTTVSDAKMIWDAMGFLEKWCEEIDSRINEGYEAAADTIGDLSEWATDKFDDLR